MLTRTLTRSLSRTLSRTLTRSLSRTLSRTLTRALPLTTGQATERRAALSLVCPRRVVRAGRGPAGARARRALGRDPHRPRLVPIPRDDRAVLIGRRDLVRNLTRVEMTAALGSGSAPRPSLLQPRPRAPRLILGSAPSRFEATRQPSSRPTKAAHLRPNPRTGTVPMVPSPRGPPSGALRPVARCVESRVPPAHPHHGP